MPLPSFTHCRDPALGRWPAQALPPHPDAPETAMLRATAENLVEAALAHGSAGAHFHGFYLDAVRHPLDEGRVVVELRVTRDRSAMVHERLRFDSLPSDAPRRD